MSAGIPGLGLGGLFYLLSALAAPLVELSRAARGTTSRARWRSVARQFALALAMIVATDLCFRGIYALATGGGLGGRGVVALPTGPLAATLAMLVVMLVAGKALHLATAAPRWAPSPTGLAWAGTPGGAPARARPGSLEGLAALTAAWLIALLVAAADLAPVPAAPTAEQRSPETRAEADGAGSIQGEAAVALGPSSALLPPDQLPEGTGEVQGAHARIGDESAASGGAIGELGQNASHGSGGSGTAPSPWPGAGQGTPGGSTPPGAPAAGPGSQNGGGGGPHPPGHGRGGNANPTPPHGPPRGSGGGPGLGNGAGKGVPGGGKGAKPSSHPETKT